MIFLFEPYSAYQKPPKKKHWMEIAEEEALLHRIALEEQANQKRANVIEQLAHEQAIQQYIINEQNAIKNNQNLALPQYSPQPSSQQVQDGQFAAPAGGGGYANPLEEEETEVVNFSFTPSIGVAPLKVYFTNLTPTPENDTFFWDFNSGSATSNIANPGSRVYNQTGSYTVTLQSTSSTGNKTIISKGPITVFNAALNAAFTVVSSSNIAGVGLWTFTDATTYNGTVAGGTITGKWQLGDGNSVTYNYLSGAFSNFYSTGSFTASLGITESLSGIKSSSSIYIVVTAPSLTANFTFVSSSDSGVGFENYVPMTANLTSTSSYNGGGLVYYNWYITTGSTVVSQSVGLFPTTYTAYIFTPGNYTASLQITESTYNITSTKNQPFVALT